MSNSLDLIWERVSVTAEKLFARIVRALAGQSFIIGPRELAGIAVKFTKCCVDRTRPRSDRVDRIIYIVLEYPYHLF